MIRTHTEPLRGKSKEDVLAFVGKLLGLSHVEEISIKPDAILVRRNIEEDAPVIPAESPEKEVIDIDFLIGKLDLRPWPLDPEAHPYVTLTAVARKLSAKGLHPLSILIPERDKGLFSAWLGFEDYQERHLLGFRVVFWATAKYSERIVVVGTSSSSGYLTDAVEGIVVDLI